MKSENEDFILEINYDKESEKEGLIKITTKKSGDVIVLDSDKMLDMISKYMKKKIGIVLSEVDRKEIWMTMITRAVNFIAPEDYKKGQQVTVKINQAYPAALLALEMEYGICKQKEGETGFYAVTHENVLEHLKNLREGNKEFTDHWVRMQTGKDPEELKKAHQKLTEENKEEAKN